MLLKEPRWSATGHASRTCVRCYPYSIIMYALMPVLTIWLTALAILASLYFLLRYRTTAAWIAALCLVGLQTWGNVPAIRTWTWANHSATLIYGLSFVAATLPVAAVFFLSYIAIWTENRPARYAVILIGSAIAAIVWSYVSLVLACASGNCL